jgi:hypothetical protein
MVILFDKTIISKRGFDKGLKGFEDYGRNR